MSTSQASEGSGAPEEPYEWAYDGAQGKWVKITAKNSQGRRCGGCGCPCPCTCLDCFHQCCS